jgi:hypothetical protein
MAENQGLPRKIVEELVDYLVYAPVGLASTVLEEMPGLVEKGRSRLTMARTIGQFAVAMGRQRVEKTIADRRAGRPHPADEEPAPGPGPDEPSGAEPAQDPAKGDEAGESGAAHAAAASADLAIPGYDALAASQVVQRLAGLSTEELEAVRAYEEATRGRRTILGRIDQLAESHGPSESRGAPEGE